jgi:hypothetical protein
VPADYAAIRRDNVERYGYDTAVLDLLGHLYSERTHFIFELIQNAEDAGATELTFELFHDRLQVRHDGRRFTEADVRGVCGVAKSSKSDDLTQIGKFGIGFKSVYAYTDTPRIYSADENFRIEKYVQPDPVAPLNEPVPGGEPETLFVFPFDRDDPPAATAAAEISAALAKIKPTTLLFLRKIERIRVCGPQAADAVLERVHGAGPTSSSRQVMLSSDHEGDDEEWLTWARQLPKHPDQRVEVAFRLETGQGEQRLVKAEATQLVVFFPTAKETSLGFLIQGPYRTTPARDNIKENDPWNQGLVCETAALLADVLRELRDGGLLTVDVLQALPIDPPRFQPGTMFRPLFDSVREAIIQDKLIPLAEGGYGSAGELKLARGTGLRKLLSPELLGELYGSGGPASFAAESITQGRTPVLWQYLREEIAVGEVTPDAVVTRLSREFLAARSDEWIGRFYAFLVQNSALWRVQGNWPGPARAKPIIRLEDGTQIPPFGPTGLGRPAAYLPGRAETEFPTVRRAVADIPEARQFLKALEFTEPDVVAEVLEKVLPRYANPDVHNLDRAKHEADLDRIASALAEVSANQRQHLHERLRSAAFLVAENEVTGELRLMTPATVYRRTADLETYLDGNTDAWFLREDYQPWTEHWRTLGVPEEPAVHARKPDTHGYVAIAGYYRGPHVRGLDRFDPNADIDGLKFALRNPSQARSVYVWNELLSPNHHLIAGVVETSSRQTFDYATRENKTSPIGTAAKTAAWLPGPDGAFLRPAGLQVDKLPAEYKRDSVLARALNMIQPVVEEASRQLGLPLDFLRDLSEHPDLVEEFQRKLKDRATRISAKTRPNVEAGTDVAQDPEPDAGEGIDYATALSDAFSRPGKPMRDAEDAVPAVGIVSNPAFRRSRVQEAIEDDKAAEPLRHERFQQIPRRVWEAKDNSVRQFLLEQYAGRCQICGETFIKRDKTPYFEGLYLVSRTKAGWIDRPGNAICLCATCCAKFQHGTVDADDILAQIGTWRPQREGGGDARLTLQLCGEVVALRFTEKHLLDLQEIITAACS